MVQAGADWTANREYVAPALAFRVPGGGMIWLFGRVVLGGLFLMSGLGKLTAPEAFAASLAKNGIPESIAPLLAWLGAGVETLGGLCIAFGLATAWACLAMIAFTIVAAFTAHPFWEAPADLRMLQMAHFEKNMMLVGAFCLLYVAGGGPYSIDRWRRFR
jgi:putative oxidoreductase